VTQKNGAKSYDWLRQIPSSLLEWDEIPLLGAMPEFPFEEFALRIGKALSLQNPAIECTDVRWRSQKDFFSGIPNHVGLHFSGAGLEDTFSLIMQKEEVATFLSRLLAPEDTSLIRPDEELFVAFYKFIAVEAIHILSQCAFDKTLSVRLLDAGEFPPEAALCCDIAFKYSGNILSGRLLLSPGFRKSWSERYAPKSTEHYLESSLASNVDLFIRLEVGKTRLSRTLWNTVLPGDFLLLENCWVDPDTESGTGRLLVHDIPIFAAELEKSRAKVAEYSRFQKINRYEEVKTAMIKKNNDDDFDDDDDFDFDDTEFEDTDFEDTEFETTGLDESFQEETDVEESQFDEKEESIEEHSIADHSQHDVPEERHVKEKTPTVPGNFPASKESDAPFSAEDVPLSISVEIGRFRMPIKKVMELQPGNLLELGARAQNGVDLVINGRCIAKGELLRIGDALGVRILEKH